MTLVAAESRITLASFLEIEGKVKQRDLKELWTQCPREPISMVWRLADQSLLCKSLSAFLVLAFEILSREL